MEATAQIPTTAKVTLKRTTTVSMAPRRATTGSIRTGATGTIIFTPTALITVKAAARTGPTAIIGTEATECRTTPNRTTQTAHTATATTTPATGMERMTSTRTAPAPVTGTAMMARLTKGKWLLVARTMTRGHRATVAMGSQTTTRQTVNCRG